jgi:cell division septal protein FtsQ
VVLRAKFKQERRDRAMKFSGWLLLLGLVGFGGWKAWQATTRFLYTADCFRIRTVDVYGGKNVSASEIIALLPFRPGDNLFKVWLSEAENDIRQCKPELKKISIGRRWKRVVVHLEERHPVASVTVNTQRMGVDFENRVFPLRGSYVKTQFPEIVAANATERRNVLEFIRQFSPQAKKLYFRIAKLYPEPVDDIVMELADGPRIFWGSSDKEDIRPKLQRLQQVMSDAEQRYQAVDYINLCYFDDGRILVKPLSQAAAAPGQVMELSSVRQRSADARANENL